MNWAETSKTFDRMLGLQVRAWIWQRQLDGVTFMGTDAPAEGVLEAADGGYRVGDLKFDVVATRFEHGEWRDVPQPSTLWITQGADAVLIAPLSHS